ncbi:hypothetical protein J27TS8_18350 [Robertmurraya siralis]|uniref:Uncharacterized protein n=1 Tax=Robertmurraya siralis TaxID=77777 RepID=A0A919WHH7_9BACI|nr:hypothetical protein [Robertmurraya siralis]GIN61842.1 hypothetical protein J27TS8_18350 [Robertmurraya siralis]
MNINLLIFVSSLNNNHKNEVLQKSYQSDFRPMIGDIVDVPGFHPQYHNGYEVVKVTINYHINMCRYGRSL